MKHLIIILSLFLYAFTIQAQSHYEIYNPIDTINSLLYKNRNIYFVDNGEIIKLKKIQANSNGIISIINNTNIDVDTSEIKTIAKKAPFLDLFEFEKIQISGSKLEFKTEQNRTHRTIYGFNNKDIFIFKKQIELLQTSYYKNKSLRLIKRYYFDFKTGYDTPGGFFTVTDNYKVKILNSIFTMSFDIFKFKEFQKTEKISFDLKDIISIYNKGTVYQEFENGYVIQPVSSSIGFKSKTMEYSLNIKLNKQIQPENTEIYKAFQELLKQQ
ncbi:hypothetical protein SLW70_10065 [Flavobacterium sp. NG2]|uniref:hypothetical protein n=1 Tax=Flavobacterium sp. NG2 TaxID=3097547 RepID=UPI002A82B7A2|nr:hypothetical protein [Flavobacterium sp. NG2]WPR70290.1 hypothetical protein SLW70_10065 [Flavobacterium sp. NG2]